MDIYCDVKLSTAHVVLPLSAIDNSLSLFAMLCVETKKQNIMEEKILSYIVLSLAALMLYAIVMIIRIIMTKNLELRAVRAVVLMKMIAIFVMTWFVILIIIATTKAVG